MFDLGYYDFSWWAALDAQGCRFVTRLKAHTRPTLIEERQWRPAAASSPTVSSAWRAGSPAIGRIRSTGRCARFASGSIPAKSCTSSATTSRPRPGDRRLYKTRWDIELFFRWVKQTLKIRRFLGMSSTPCDPDRRRPDRLSAAAHGARRAAHRRQHPHLRAPGARQPHAIPGHRSLAAPPNPQTRIPASSICTSAEPDSSGTCPGSNHPRASEQVVGWVVGTSPTMTSG